MSERATAAEILRGLVNEIHLELAETVSQKTGQSIPSVLLDLELIDDNRLADALADALKLRRFVPATTQRDPGALYVLDRDFARDYQCLPVAFDAGHLVLAMVDPLDSATIEAAVDAAGYPVRPVVATRRELDQAFTAWAVDSGGMAATARAAGHPPSLAIPTAVFLGYPDGVGVTSLIWNLAYVIGRRRPVLLVSIGGPPEHGLELQELSDLGAHLTVVPDAALVPDRLADLSERAEAGDAPRFEIALAEVDRPTFAVDAQQVALWARTIVLVTDPEHAGGSWDLVRGMYAESPGIPEVSVGVVMNKSRSPEAAEVGMAALDAAARSGVIADAVRLWDAGSLPFEPDAIQRAESAGKLIVEALPHHPLARGLRALSRHVLAEVQASRGSVE
jgi:hypothetical protein